MSLDIPRLEPVKIPHFTKYETCAICQGRGWKQERGGYSMITCPACFGAKRLPVMSADGQFEKRS